MKIHLRNGDKITLELPNGQNVLVEYREGENQDFPNCPEIEISLPQGNDGRFPIAETNWRLTVPNK